MGSGKSSHENADTTPARGERGGRHDAQAHDADGHAQTGAFLPGLAERLGNRGMQALLVKRAMEPNDAAEQRRKMSNSFGISFADVRLRTDDEAAARAEQAGANAYTDGREIGFARGAYEPRTPVGRLIIAHEFAHVAQSRGGNMGSSSPSLGNTTMAEWQAQRAAASVAGLSKPRVAGYRENGLLFDIGKGASAGPSLASSDDDELLAMVLKMLDTLPNGEQRRGAISFLVGLAVQKGKAQKAATARLFNLLAGIPAKNIDDHMAAIEELKSWTAKDVRAYDLLLYGRYWFADRSKKDIGSGLALDAFRKYLHYDGGKWAVLFFKLRINGADKFKANLAARVVADLLEGESDPAEKKYSTNYAALRAMARENGWESYGPLGVASATPRIFSALDSVRQQARAIRRQVISGPYGDPLWEADSKRLENFANALDTLGPQSTVTPQGISVLLYSAENREETEHELMARDPTSQAEATQEMARALTIAVDAGAKLQGRIEVLHANAGALDEFLGKDAARGSDERLALFDLRHEYIDTWLSVFGSNFGPSSGGLAVGYQSRLNMIDYRFENFDQVVAQRKFKSARSRYQEYFKLWNDGNLKYPGNDKLDETFFFTMRRALQKENDTLGKGFSTGFTAQLGSGQIVSMKASDDYAPTDLRQVAALDRDTSIFGLQAAIFLVYATNLSLHNMMIKSDVGSSTFRATQGARLIAMRTELEGFWNKGDFDSFLKKTDGYQATLKSVVDEIKDRVKIDLLLNLAITLIAALVTEGAALAVRLASLSEVLAIARTARAISSVSTLVSVGVFTTTELTLQKAFFGKDITVAGVAKTAATNLVFLGALKAVGKLAEPLAQGSVVRQLVIGHLVGFTGVAAVSATLTRIETGQWPPDVASFLAQTAVTYLLIAGMHHAFQELAAKPMLESAAGKRWDQLKIDNQALADKLRSRVDTGTLTQTEFEAMRAERIRIVEEARALHQVMKDGGLISATDLAAVNKVLDNAIADASGAKFPLGASAGVDPVLKALPAPDSVLELTRVGDSDTYVYDPAKSRGPVNTMLERYKEKGFTVSGNDALTRVVDPMGRTRFLLTSAPIASPRLLLPPASMNPIPSSSDALARATGLADASLDKARSALATINRDVETKLPADGYPDHTVLATLALLVEQSSNLVPNWPIDGVRGVADALSLERGIPRSAVRRLFMTVEPKKLPDLFKAFHDIANSPKVAPGSRYLIADDLLPKNSVTLIDAWREMQAKGLELPGDMDMRATRGVARQIDKMPGGWLQWLSGIAKDQRAAKLRAVSGLTDPTVRLPENVTELLASISADIPGQPGLNPLAGANGEAFMKQIEAKSPLAKFADPILRAVYVSKVDSLRLDVALLEQGNPLEHGNWENIVGRANEVRKIASVLLSGSTILVSDRDVGPKGQLPGVDLSSFALPGGGKVINAPPGKDVHLDLLFNDSAGSLNALEMTTGELTLPTECSALDPKNPAYGSDVDWAALELKKASATHRKFMQAIKIYQLSKMATALGQAWSGQSVDPATTRFQAGDFSAGAARALENMGFKLELLDGTSQTAAQVEARKNPAGSKSP